MKIRYIKILAIVAILFTMGCDDKEGYDYDAIIPKVLDGVQGPTEAVQTFTATYSTSYFRGGSTWTWTASDAKIKSVSDDTHSAVVEFDQYPADGYATITVTETTHGGLTSDPATLEVLVKKYCPLTNGVNDLVGTWTGDDGWFDCIITSAVSGGKLQFSGMSFGFIEGFWGETVIDSKPIEVTINEDGTLEIPRQYVYTTEYDGDTYDYEIKGSGTWDNCGGSPVLVIKYDVYYAGDSAGLAETYSSYLDNIPYLTANITLSNDKKAIVLPSVKLSAEKLAALKACHKK